MADTTARTKPGGGAPATDGLKARAKGYLVAAYKWVRENPLKAAYAFLLTMTALSTTIGLMRLGTLETGQYDGFGVAGAGVMGIAIALGMSLIIPILANEDANRFVRFLLMPFLMLGLVILSTMFAFAFWWEFIAEDAVQAREFEDQATEIANLFQKQENSFDEASASFSQLSAYFADRSAVEARDGGTCGDDSARGGGPRTRFRAEVSARYSTTAKRFEELELSVRNEAQAIVAEAQTVGPDLSDLSDEERTSVIKGFKTRAEDANRTAIGSINRARASNSELETDLEIMSGQASIPDNDAIFCADRQGARYIQDARASIDALKPLEPEQLQFSNYSGGEAVRTAITRYQNLVGLGGVFQADPTQVIESSDSLPLAFTFVIDTLVIVFGLLSAKAERRRRLADHFGEIEEETRRNQDAEKSLGRISAMNAANLTTATMSSFGGLLHRHKVSYQGQDFIILPANPADLKPSLRVPYGLMLALMDDATRKSRVVRSPPIKEWVSGRGSGKTLSILLSPTEARKLLDGEKLETPFGRLWRRLKSAAGLGPSQSLGDEPSLPGDAGESQDDGGKPTGDGGAPSSDGGAANTPPPDEAPGQDPIRNDLTQLATDEGDGDRVDPDENRDRFAVAGFGDDLDYVTRFRWFEIVSGQEHVLAEMINAFETGTLTFANAGNIASELAARIDAYAQEIRERKAEQFMRERIQSAEVELEARQARMDAELIKAEREAQEIVDRASYDAANPFGFYANSNQRPGKATEDFLKNREVYRKNREDLRKYREQRDQERAKDRSQYETQGRAEASAQNGAAKPTGDPSETKEQARTAETEPTEGEDIGSGMPADGEADVVRDPSTRTEAMDGEITNGETDPGQDVSSAQDEASHGDADGAAPNGEVSERRENDSSSEG